MYRQNALESTKHPYHMPACVLGLCAQSGDSVLYLRREPRYLPFGQPKELSVASPGFGLPWEHSKPQLDRRRCALAARQERLIFSPVGLARWQPGAAVDPQSAGSIHTVGAEFSDCRSRAQEL